MSALFGFLFALILLGGAAAGGGYLYAQHVYTAAGPATADGSQRVVLIPQGASVQTIAARLTEAGAISDDLPFRLAVRFTNTATKLKAGEYAIESGASLKGVIGLLQSGRTMLHAVTIPEGLTSAQILRRLAEAEILTGDVPEVMPAEGVLLPDTYMVHRGETREALISRMITAQQTLMADLWPDRQPGLPFDTQDEAINLASIVEKETGLAAERPLVAGVFVNRLRKRMKLESDPTIIYGLTGGEPLGRGLRRSEIDRQNPYSTYQIPRLPPTPISNPGRDSIAAVLNPPVTDALFFVADGSGGHAFSVTYAEHLRNVAKLRELEAAKAAN